MISTINQRLYLLAHVKSQISDQRIAFGYREDLDRGITVGYDLLCLCPHMFWTDTDFLEDILEFLKASRKLLTKIAVQLDMNHINDFSYYLTLQDAAVEDLIAKQIANPENKKVYPKTQSFINLPPPEKKQGYN